jgi:hypothetical protein
MLYKHHIQNPSQIFYNVFGESGYECKSLIYNMALGCISKVLLVHYYTVPHGDSDSVLELTLCKETDSGCGKFISVYQHLYRDMYCNYNMVEI